jgi:hypothetical protein
MYRQTFNSINETKKPIYERVYHNNKECQASFQIREDETRQGNAGYRLCTRCKRLNAKARRS